MDIYIYSQLIHSAVSQRQTHYSSKIKKKKQNYSVFTRLREKQLWQVPCKRLKGSRSSQMVHIQKGDEALETHEGSTLYSVHSGKERENAVWASHSDPTEFSTDVEPRRPVLMGTICKEEVSGSWQEHLRWTVNLTRSNCLSTQGLRGTVNWWVVWNLLEKNFCACQHL